jgi:hypothetical protein
VAEALLQIGVLEDPPGVDDEAGEEPSDGTGCDDPECDSRKPRSAPHAHAPILQTAVATAVRVYFR